MTNFPEPLIPAHVDLRTFDRMPLDVLRLLNSDIVLETSGDEFKAAVLLWARSWHQQPAGSLPDDDTKLAHMAMYGRNVRGWKRVRHGALRGFVRCSDGRLYHPVITEIAKESWAKKTSGKNGAERRWRESNALKNLETRNAFAPSDQSRGKASCHIPRTELNRTESPLPPAGGVGEDVTSITDELWSLAGQSAVADRKRASGSVDDFRHVRGWLGQGYKRDEITSAAANVLRGVGEIRSLWGLLAKAMPEALAKARREGEADCAPLTEDAMRTMARLYFAVGTLQEGGTTTGDPWKIKPKCKWQWPHDAFGPGHPRCKVPRKVFDRVATELGVPEVDWPRIEDAA